MKKKALISIKKKIKGFLEGIQPSAASMIRQYMEGENFQMLLSLNFSMIRKINESAMKELAETLADPNKFEEVFTYDLLIGDRSIYDQHTVDSDPKIELFNGMEFRSPDYRTVLYHSYLIFFLLGRETNTGNVIMITGAEGVSNAYKLFSRVNTTERNTCVFQQKAA